MDDRPLETAEQAIGRIDTKLADVESTLLARVNRRPTGDVELAFRPTPKEGTIFLQGQTLNRADYQALWDWASTTGAVVAGGYGAGNGSTTFTLPDFRNKVLRGASSGALMGELLGADSQTLSVAQMPSHTHTTTADSHTHGGSISSAGSHIHDSANGTMGSAGSHAGHNSGSFPITGGGPNATSGNTQVTLGGHTHFFTFDILSAGAHTHTITTAADSHTHTVEATGSGAAVDMRQASIGINVAVWT